MLSAVGPPLAITHESCRPQPEWEIAVRGDGVVLGESPVWSVAQHALFWLDIDGRRVHRSQPDRTDTIQLTAIPGALGLVAGHPMWMWIATDEGVCILDWESLQSCLVVPSPLPHTQRFNDGKVDPRGDLVVGSMVTEADAVKRQGAGALWRIALPRAPKQPLRTERLLDGATIPNGLDFDPARPGSMWWIDTSLNRVDQLELAEGKVERRVAFETKQLRGAQGAIIGGGPDGMTRDEEGCLWVCMAGGGYVCRFSPSGTLLRSIRFPVSKVTSLCFGGLNMRDLYVTSASKGVDRSKEPLAGSVFIVRNAGRGRSMNELQADFQPLQFAFAERHHSLTQHQLAASPSAGRPTLRSKL